MLLQLFLLALGFMSAAAQIFSTQETHIPCVNDSGCNAILHSIEGNKCLNGYCMCVNTTKKAYEYCSKFQNGSHQSILLGSRRAVESSGETCESDADCIEGARCVKSAGGNSTRCDCEPHSVLSGDKKRCLTEARELGDKCAESLQCSQTLGGAECSLMDHTCRCRPNFHFAESTKRCIKNKIFGEACTQEEESCYQLIDPPGENALRCSSKGHCKCVQGFDEYNTQCYYSGASRMAYHFSLVLLLVALSL